MPRLGPGPVFAYESAVASRRWQVYALRALFVLALLAGLALTWWSMASDLEQRLARGLARRALAGLGESFYNVLSTIQLALVLVAAPAATAGAVCLDRSRGTLTHMLVTDLTDAEVVLGKLGARLAPVCATVFASIPVLALASLLGGIIPETLVSLTLISLSLAAFGCALALALSVRLSKPQEVLTVVFGLWAVWIVGLLIWEIVSGPTALPRPPDWWSKLNPFVLAWAPYSWPSWSGPADVPIFLAVTLTATALLSAYAILRLRAESAGKERRRWAVFRAIGAVAKRLPVPRFSGPSLDPNPVLWREWHLNRPSRVVRAVWGLYTAAVLTSAAIGLWDILESGVGRGEKLLAILNGFAVWFGLLVVSVTAPTALGEERVRGSLDVLMSTPMATRSIVLAKWWGAFRAVPWIVAVPALCGVFLALAPDDVTYTRVAVTPAPGVKMTAFKTVASDPITPLERTAAVLLPLGFALATGAVVASLGLLLATWFKRPGRAMAVNASVYIILSVGWVFAIELVLVVVLEWLGYKIDGGRDDWIWLVYGLLSLCPLGGQMAPSEMILFQHRLPRLRYWAFAGVSVLAMFALAAVLLGLTLLTFNRCLGRCPERPHGPTHPRRRPKPASRPEPMGMPSEEPALAVSP
jgi:ABC-type transport system involved in multi-copper enzyme maturation permease subunit